MYKGGTKAPVKPQTALKLHYIQGLSMIQIQIDKPENGIDIIIIDTQDVKEQEQSHLFLARAAAILHTLDESLKHLDRS